MSLGQSENAADSGLHFGTSRHCGIDCNFWWLKISGRNLVFAPGGRNVLVPGERPAEPEIATCQLAGVTYLMVTAIHFDQLISESASKDFAEIDRLENVSRAREAQILNQRLLALDIQEALLRLPRTTSGHDRFNFREVQSIALESDWKVQRRK